MRTLGIFLTGAGVGMLAVVFFWGKAAPAGLLMGMALSFAAGGVFWSVGRQIPDE